MNKEQILENTYRQLSMKINYLIHKFTEVPDDSPDIVDIVESVLFYYPIAYQMREYILATNDKHRIKDWACLCQLAESYTANRFEFLSFEDQKAAKQTMLEAQEAGNLAHLVADSLDKNEDLPVH